VSLKVSLILGFVLSHAANAQRPSEIEKYGHRLTRSADSVLAVAHKIAPLLSSITTEVPSERAFQTFLVMDISAVMMKKTMDDFDAVPAPRKLTNVHRQMMDALRYLVAAALDVGTANNYASCREEAKANLDCNPNQRGEEIGRRVLADIQEMASATNDYLAARARAASLMKELGVTLPALNLARFESDSAQSR
jgi:hypothetical protein